MRCERTGMKSCKGLSRRIYGYGNTTRVRHFQAPLTPEWATADYDLPSRWGPLTEDQTGSQADAAQREADLADGRGLCSKLSVSRHVKRRPELQKGPATRLSGAGLQFPRFSASPCLCGRRCGSMRSKRRSISKGILVGPKCQRL